MDAGLIVVAALIALLAVLLVALFRPRKPRKPRQPDGVIHIIRRDAAGRLVDEPIGFYDPPKRRRRKHEPPTP